MRSDELQHRIFWRIRSQSIGCTGRIKTRHNRIRKPEKCRMGTRMEQSFFGSSHWSDSRGRGWEVSFERKTFRKSGFGFGESTKCAAGSERTSQYNQYKSEEERERRARQKGGKSIGWCFLRKSVRRSKTVGKDGRWILFLVLCPDELYAFIMPLFLLFLPDAEQLSLTMPAAAGSPWRNPAHSASQ